MRTAKDKDMGVLRDTESAKSQLHKPRAELKDYSLKNRVTMEWDLNQDSVRDRMFRITVGNEIAILDWEEVLKAGRFI